MAKQTAVAGADGGREQDGSGEAALGALRSFARLSAAQRKEVCDVAHLVADAVSDGTISQHFGDWIMQQLAEEKAREER